MDPNNVIPPETPGSILLKLVIKTGLVLLKTPNSDAHVSAQEKA